MSVKSGQSGLTSGQREAIFQAHARQAAADEDLGELWDADLNEKALKPLAGKKVILFEVPHDVVSRLSISSTLRTWMDYS